MKKRFFRILLGIILFVLLVTGGLVFNTPLRVFYQRWMGRSRNALLEEALQKDWLKIYSHEIEIRFSPGMITGKSIIEYETGGEQAQADFQPFALNKNFTFDSIKLNGKDVDFEKWFTCEEVTFWKVYLTPDGENEAKRENLCLLYAGKLPRKNEAYFFPPDQFWYARTPGMLREEKLSLFKCIVDQNWVPVFSGILDSVTDIRDDVKAYQFVMPHPASAAMLYVGKKEKVQTVETGDFLYDFYGTETNGSLFSLLIDKTLETTAYFRELFGDLPLREHSFIFEQYAPVAGDATIYQTVLHLGFQRPAFYQNRERAYQLEDDINLADKIARAWWTGAVMGSAEKGGSLAAGLARYAAYLALCRLQPPEQARVFLEDCYHNYLVHRGKYGKYEKALFEIFPVLDWQKDLLHYKAPLVWHAFRYQLGDDLFLELLRRFYGEYRGRVGTVQAFQELAAKVSEMELDWFFDYFFYSNAALDLRVEEVTTTAREEEEGYLTRIRMEHGENSRPFRGRVLLRVETAEEVQEETLIWSGGGEEVLVTTLAPPLTVTLDPEEWWPDVNRENNRWYAEIESESGSDSESESESGSDNESDSESGSEGESEDGSENERESASDLPI